jgi:lysophospholipase L1-like esterase
LTPDQKKLLDWPDLARYRDANRQVMSAVADKGRVIFFGDSITDSWNLATFFPGKPYLNRGVSGQTTPQMLVRFRPDVIDLKPAVVLILAGTNDIAGNTGPTTLEAIEGNLTSMVELAKVNGIQPVLCSVLPAYDYPWHPGQEPAEKIIALNAWMKSYAAQHDLIYLDYFPALEDSRHGMRPELSRDGVHPNAAGYAIMQRLAESAIAKALKHFPQ